MYASIMWNHFRSVFLILTATWFLAGCHTASQKAATPVPESEQVVRTALKELYMKVSTASPQSREQQKLILRMAQEANSGKELVLTMRAAVGVFPSEAGWTEESVKARVESVVTEKMRQLAALDQLIEYAAEYPVDPAQAQRYMERLFELGKDNSDPRVWYRIRATASRLKVNDLEKQAQIRGDQLANR